MAGAATQAGAAVVSIRNRVKRYVAGLLPLAFTLALLLPASESFACSCCTNTAQRRIGDVPLEADRFDEIARLRFEEAASLYLSDDDDATVTGIDKPDTRYRLAAVWQDGRFTFTFHDTAGRTGTLTLARPQHISIFEVDPRDPAPAGGLGPLLYKEWKLTAPALGNGIFASGIGDGQTLTLILHGRGRNCANADDFTHWTLTMQGPKANYVLYGALRAAAK